MTEKNIYNYQRKKNKSSKKLPFIRIDGLTVSKESYKKSDEFLIHMKGGYDHRYYAGKLRDTIVDILLKIRKSVSAQYMKNH